MKNKKTRYAQSRFQRNILLFSAFLLFCAFILLDKRFHSHSKNTTKAAVQRIYDVNDWNKYNEKVFTVVKVIDGDTIDINIPDANWSDTRIRLLGIDAPETKDPNKPVMYYGPEASKFVSDTVLKKNITVIMDANSKARDKYSRLLAYIKLENGKILNEELISRGFAYADTRFPHSYYKKYIKLEEKAIKEKKGLWKNVRIDQMPEWRQNRIIIPANN